LQFRKENLTILFFLWGSAIYPIKITGAIILKSGAAVMGICRQTAAGTNFNKEAQQCKLIKKFL
jgi:hypothetical protein